jgi:hypothetical protein
MRTRALTTTSACEDVVMRLVMPMMTISLSFNQLLELLLVSPTYKDGIERVGLVSPLSIQTPISHRSV